MYHQFPPSGGFAQLASRPNHLSKLKFVESYFSPTDLVAFEVWDELADADETYHLTISLDG